MKKPIALLLTDCHLSEFNIDLVEKFWEEAVSVCKKNQISRIIFLGDFNDIRKSLPIETLLSMKKIFSNTLKNSDLVSDIIVGNHDRAISSKDSYLSLFNGISKNIRIYEDISFLEEEKFDFVFLPYREGKFDLYYKEILNHYQDKKCNKKQILFGHQQITEIPVEVQVKFDKIFLGHLHEKESVSERVNYIGSAFQQNFSEDNLKGFTILYDNLSTTQIKFEFKEYIIQSIDLNIFDETKAKTFILNFKKDNPDKFLRVVLEGFDKDVSSLKDFCKQNNVDCLSNIQNVLDTHKEVVSFDSLSDQQIRNYFEEFLKSENLSKGVEETLIELIKKRN